MTVKKTERPSEVVAKTLTEVFDDIAKSVEQASPISELRQHAIESQLRICIRQMGFRPRETKQAPASIPELASQCQRALKVLKGIALEGRHDILAQHALAVLSNLEWEIKENLTKNQEVPLAPEAPAE